MATLEKIRSKSVLLLVVIGVALFAFIIGDFLNSGSTFFGSGRTIATVDGEKIDILDFQKRYEEVSQQYQQQGYKQDPAVTQQQVLNQMIQEMLLNDEMEELGITVTNKELSQAMLGQNALPAMVQFANQFGVQTPDQLHDLAFNPAKYNIPAEQASQLQAMWMNQEKQIDELLRMQKLGSLFTGAITANALDAKALYDENAATTHIAYAKKDYASLANDQFPVSASEIKDMWSKEKNGYRLDEETRLVNYITVNIAPSAEDNIAAQQAIEEAIANLKATPGTEGVSNDFNFNVERISQPASRITNAQLKSFATSTAVDSVSIVSYTNNVYTIGKLLGSKVEVDSVNVDMLAFQGTNAQRDSILNVLNSGVAFAEVAATAGVQGSQEKTWFSLANETSPIKAKLLSEATGRFFIGDSIQGTTVFYRVNERKAPVKIYDIASITYTVEPSQTTLNNLLTKLRDFVTTNNTDTAFTASKAIAAGYQLLNARVSASTPTIGNVPESRDAVKWVMNADKGDVSDIFRDEQDKRLLAVAVTDIYDEYVPADDKTVAANLTEKVRNNKKAADLLAKYEGKANDLAGYAALMETSIDTTDVTFGQRFVAGLGIDEAAITGQAVVAKPNTLVGPVKTNHAIVVYQVVNVDTENRPYNYDESAAMFNRQFGADALSYRIVQILRNNKDIENNMLDFYNN
ncbi:MAG: SurA N-terminal domain-containing protein [Muribaculaceae bacterium]|nr:SurA N-terminal domain-containing protein [Muribaculaceae bacterium]